MDMNDEGFDRTAFRCALGRFLTGVTIVTTMDGGRRPRGFTANSFTSVSLDPPLVLVCVANTSLSHAAFMEAHSFAVNILQLGQIHISNTFASRRLDKFGGLDFATGVTGSPLLPDSTAWFDCKTIEKIEVGDHTVLIGHVLDFRHSDRPPPGYLSGGYIN